MSLRADEVEPTPEELRAAAHDLVDRGFSPLPLVRGGKIPPRGFPWANLGRTSHEDVDGWWTRYPLANVGIMTGWRSSLLVIDVDVKDGKDGLARLRELEAELGPLPPTYTVRTPSGGLHLYFRQAFPEGVDKQRWTGQQGRFGSRVLPGVDTRAEGNLIVAPPSFLPGAGLGRYMVISGA